MTSFLLQKGDSEATCSLCLGINTGGGDVPITIGSSSLSLLVCLPSFVLTLTIRVGNWKEHTSRKTGTSYKNGSNIRTTPP